MEWPIKRLRHHFDANFDPNFDLNFDLTVGQMVFPRNRTFGVLSSPFSRGALRSGFGNFLGEASFDPPTPRIDRSRLETTIGPVKSHFGRLPSHPEIPAVLLQFFLRALRLCACLP